VDGGGAMFCTGGGLELSGTIGQPDAGIAAGGRLELVGGFWFPVVPGDCNTDGAADLVDFDSLHPCVTGPEGGLTRGCECYDIDGDEDVDLSDVAEFQRRFYGI